MSFCVRKPNTENAKDRIKLKQITCTDMFVLHRQIGVICLGHIGGWEVEGMRQPKEMLDFFDFIPRLMFNIHILIVSVLWTNSLVAKITKKY